MHPAPDENPTRGTHVIDENDQWRPAEAEMVTHHDTTGTGSVLAMSEWQFTHRPPEWPSWPWMVGPNGYRSEMGVPYTYNIGPCTSTNKSCHCGFCQSPTINGHCVCPRHQPEEP